MFLAVLDSIPDDRPSPLRDVRSSAVINEVPARIIDLNIAAPSMKGDIFVDGNLKKRIILERMYPLRSPEK